MWRWTCGPLPPTYRAWVGVELDAARRNALFIPEGCAHGFLTLEPDCEVFYLVSAGYAPDHAQTYRWDDPTFGIAWPHAPVSISHRDATAGDYCPQAQPEPRP